MAAATLTRPTAKKATSKKSAAPANSRAEFKKDVDKLLDQLTSGTPEHVIAFVEQMADIRARAHHMHGVFKLWSLSNRLMLAAQANRRGAAVRDLFAGVDQWRKIGREVRADELTKPYLIFGSPIVTRRVDEDDPDAPRTMYRTPPIIHVYDWSQTAIVDGSDVEEPDWAVPLGYGDYATLTRLAASSPVPVTFTDLGGRAEHGWLNAEGITVNSAMPIANQIATLAHELTHHHLGHLGLVTDTKNTAASSSGDEYNYSIRAVCEQEAAAGQWLVMKMLGLDEQVGNDVTTYCAEYLMTWIRTDADGNQVQIEGYKGRRKLLLKRLDVAMSAADKVVNGFLEQA